MILIANICVHFQLLFGGWLITSAEKQNIQIESLKLGRDRRLVIPAVFELSIRAISLASELCTLRTNLKQETLIAAISEILITDHV